MVWRLRTLFEGGLGSGSFNKLSAKVGTWTRGKYSLAYEDLHRYRTPLQASISIPHKSSWYLNGVISSRWTKT